MIGIAIKFIFLRQRIIRFLLQFFNIASSVSIVNEVLVMVSSCTAQFSLRMFTIICSLLIAPSINSRVNLISLIALENCFWSGVANFGNFDQFREFKILR